MNDKPEPIELGFATAYEDLKAITERLNNEEVEADELVDLLRRGRGLEAALRQHLTSIEQEVEAIESGKDIAAYRITRAQVSAEAADVPADTSDFGEPAKASGSDDDIPF